MSLEKYVTVLSRCEHLGSDVRIIDMNILLAFSRRAVLSIYKIWSMNQHDKILGKPMAYKNIHRHVTNLKSLGFIELVKQKSPTKHGAIYYRISEAGMFQLALLASYSPWVFDLPSILDNHGNFLIFETLLYPYFKRETLAAIKSKKDPLVSSYRYRTKGRATHFLAFEITKAILEYLNNCCKEIFEVIKDNAKIQALDHGRDSRPPKIFLDALDKVISPLKEILIMSIFLRLRHHIETAQMNILSILAQDERFMKIAHDLQKDFKRSFDFGCNYGPDRSFLFPFCTSNRYTC